MNSCPFDIAKVSGFEKLNGEQFLRYFLLSFNYPTFCLSFDTAKKTIFEGLKREQKNREMLLSLVEISINTVGCICFDSFILVATNISFYCGWFIIELFIV